MKKRLQALKLKNFLLLLVAGTVNAFGVTMFLTPVGLYYTLSCKNLIKKFDI